ncbi:MAG: adaptor protein MecA [Oscillospiraceae bacterium]|nr:adaptor protein MecA [Oscillospiraceae bacterium]
MDIYNIGKTAMTVYIPSDELRSQGLDAESITAEETEALLKDAVPEIDEYCLRLEIYPGRDEVLVFMFFSLREPKYFKFDGIENVINAAKCCNDEPSKLFFSEPYYILAVYPWRGEDTPAALFEFGAQLNAPQGYENHLREHGKTLIDADAICFLSHRF